MLSYAIATISANSWTTQYFCVNESFIPCCIGVSFFSFSSQKIYTSLSFISFALFSSLNTAAGTPSLLSIRKTQRFDPSTYSKYALFVSSLLAGSVSNTYVSTSPVESSSFCKAFLAIVYFPPHFELIKTRNLCLISV